MAKRIVVCLDGTWNKPGQTDEDSMINGDSSGPFNETASDTSKRIVYV